MSERPSPGGREPGRQDAQTTHKRTDKQTDDERRRRLVGPESRSRSRRPIQFHSAATHARRLFTSRPARPLVWRARHAHARRWPGGRSRVGRVVGGLQLDPVRRLSSAVSAAVGLVLVVGLFVGLNQSSWRAKQTAALGLRPGFTPSEPTQWELSVDRRKGSVSITLVRLRLARSTSRRPIRDEWPNNNLFAQLYHSPGLAEEVGHFRHTQGRLSIKERAL